MSDAIAVLLEAFQPFAWLIALLIVLFSVLWVFWSFVVPFSIQVRKPFLEKQLEYITQLCEVTSELAMPMQEWQYRPEISRNTSYHPVFMAREKFWKLYFGPIKLIADEELQKAVSAFAARLASHSTGADPSELQRLSDEVAKAGRKLIVRSWRTGLNPLHTNGKE